jgi:formate hydrogenlyase subunit 3/multisubunit Na+/H+ antiporter MnhD subunit
MGKWVNRILGAIAIVISIPFFVYWIWHGIEYLLSNWPGWWGAEVVIGAIPWLIVVILSILLLLGGLMLFLRT